MTVLQAIFVVVVGAVVWLIAQAVGAAINNEYASWAPALARVYVRLAGLICGSHCDRWQADVAYVQREEGRSGLYEATLCLLGALGLAVHELPAHVRSRVGRKTVRVTGFSAGIGGSSASVVAVSAGLVAVSVVEATLTIGVTMPTRIIAAQCRSTRSMRRGSRFMYQPPDTQQTGGPPTTVGQT